MAGFWRAIGQLMFGTSEARNASLASMVERAPAQRGGAAAFATPKPPTPRVRPETGRFRLDTDEIDVVATGKGRRAKFAGDVPVACSCGHTFAVSALGFADRGVLGCRECGQTAKADDHELQEVIDTIQDLIAMEIDELGVDLKDDAEEIIEFIAAYGRFPKKSELSAQGYPVNLVGEQFRQDAIRRCRIGERVALLREVGNPHDPDAIAVESGRGETIGYIPKDNFVQRVVHQDGKGCAARIWKIETGRRGFREVVLDVEVIDEAIDTRTWAAER